MTLFNPKDFIETAEGLRFAVVDSRLEEDRVLCFLRYVNDKGIWCKRSTDEANACLRQHHPLYLHYSKALDAHLHAVPVCRIVKHHRPRQRFFEIMAGHCRDKVERDAFRLGGLLKRQGLDLSLLGVTGSLLLGVQKQSSDIDLVCYGRDTFHRCRAAVQALIEQDEVQPLTEQDWRESFRRRNCSLKYQEYVWHERRKFNKALVNGRKFDLNLLEIGLSGNAGHYRKVGPITLQCRIIGDDEAFGYPAIYTIEHENIEAIVCFTATYTGQAVAGEWVEASGLLEESDTGIRRIVVGSSREAPGEHIKVVHD